MLDYTYRRYFSFVIAITIAVSNCIAQQDILIQKMENYDQLFMSEFIEVMAQAQLKEIELTEQKLKDVIEQRISEKYSEADLSALRSKETDRAEEYQRPDVNVMIVDYLKYYKKDYLPKLQVAQQSFIDEIDSLDSKGILQLKNRYEKIIEDRMLLKKQQLDSQIHIDSTERAIQLLFIEQERELLKIVPRISITRGSNDLSFGIAFNVLFEKYHFIMKKYEKEINPIEKERILFELKDMVNAKPPSLLSISPLLIEQTQRDILFRILVTN